MAHKRYLVTGGLGFLGSALVRSLVKAGHRVRVFDNASRGAMHRLADVAADVEVIEGDIRNADQVLAAVRGVDSVCHLAYINGTRFFYERPAQVLEVGVKGMLHVLDACIAAGVGELVLASSSEVYQVPPTIPTPEEVPLIVPDPLNPRYSYGGGKIISELLVLNYGRQFLERVLVFRPHNVYGPDMGWEHVIPEFVMRLYELTTIQPKGALDFPIQGTGEETRAYIFINDFTRGLLQVLAHGQHLGIYNIGTVDETPVRVLAETIAACFGRKIRIRPGMLLAGSTPRRCPDISKLREIGFEPETSLEVGIQQTSEWYRNHAHLRPAET